MIYQEDVHAMHKPAIYNALSSQLKGFDDRQAMYYFSVREKTTDSVFTPQIITASGMFGEYNNSDLHSNSKTRFIMSSK